MVTSILISLPILISILPILGNIAYPAIFHSHVVTPIFHSIFMILTIITTLTAIKANKNNPTTKRAWLYFFIGTCLLFISGFVRLFTQETACHISKALFVVSIIPILIFVSMLTKPLRYFLFSKTQKTRVVIIYLTIGIIVIGVVLLPVILKLHMENRPQTEILIIRALNTLFQLALVFPISGILVVFGIKPGNISYLLIGIAFFAGITTEILELYRSFFPTEILRTLILFSGYLQITYLFLGSLTETICCRKLKDHSQSVSPST